MWGRDVRGHARGRRMGCCLHRALWDEVLGLEDCAPPPAGRAGAWQTRVVTCPSPGALTLAGCQLPQLLAPALHEGGLPVRRPARAGRGHPLQLAPYPGLGLSGVLLLAATRALSLSWRPALCGYLSPAGRPAGERLGFPPHPGAGSWLGGVLVGLGRDRNQAALAGRRRCGAPLPCVGCPSALTGCLLRRRRRESESQRKQAPEGGVWWRGEGRSAAPLPSVLVATTAPVLGAWVRWSSCRLGEGGVGERQVRLLIPSTSRLNNTNHSPISQTGD